MDKPIEFFRREHEFLSNFWLHVIVLDDRGYASVEHAFQASKTLVLNERKLFEQPQMKPVEAKRLGRKVTLRPGWDEMKLQIMERLVSQKFEDPELRAQLLFTGESELRHGNEWRDIYWGICRGQGQNHLGKILMKVRTTIRETI